MNGIRKLNRNTNALISLLLAVFFKPVKIDGIKNNRNTGDMNMESTIADTNSRSDAPKKRMPYRNTLGDDDSDSAVWRFAHSIKVLKLSGEFITGWADLA